MALLFGPVHGLQVIGRQYPCDELIAVDGFSVFVDVNACCAEWCIGFSRIMIMGGSTGGNAHHFGRCCDGGSGFPLGVVRRCLG